MVSIRYQIMHFTHVNFLSLTFRTSTQSLGFLKKARAMGNFKPITKAQLPKAT